MDIVLAVVLVGLLILLHELGHFVTAKAAGVRVKAFSVGFGPPIVKVVRGETAYQVGLLPFGGYVMFDEAIADHRSFEAQSAARRAMIAVAGVAANLVVVVLTLIILFEAYGLPTPRPVIARVLAGSPAATAGIRPGDQLISVGNVRVAASPHRVGEVVAAHDHEPITVALGRGGRTRYVTVVPRTIDGAVRIGIVFGSTLIYSGRGVGVGARLLAGFRGTGNLIGLLVGQIASLVTGRTSTANLGGPVKVVEVTSQVAQSGVPSLLYWLALLSANLAVLNAVPFPGLDGGRLAFLFVEWLSRGRRSVHIEQMVNLIGLAVLMIFIGALTLHDLAH